MKKQANALRWQGRSWLGGKTLLLAAILCALCVTPAQADFFSYTGEDGVQTFTNTPTSRGAVRILREGRPKKTAKIKPEETLKSDLTFSDRDPRMPVQGTVTSRVGMRHDPIDGGMKHHNGVDIAVPTGTRVRAIAAGRVVESAARGGYGNLVAIEHAGGMVSLYGHNAELEVKVGEKVEAGQTVALSGSTGRSTGPHLHFELWKDGVNVTQAYLENGMGIPEVAESIRSYLSKDGSLVFTNMN